MIRNRIIDHVTVRAGELIPHPDNCRRHPKRQRDTLRASYEEVGFARSLLGFRSPDGRIQLIDGHLRRDLDPEMPVTVEVLDVNEDEARKLLLLLDPLAALAEVDTDALAKLTEQIESDSELLNQFWQSLAQTTPADEPLSAAEPAVAEQFLVLVECGSEAQQVEVLERLRGEGLSCRALLS